MISEKNREQRILEPKDREFVTDVLKIIKQNYPCAYKRLQELYKSSKTNIPYYEYLMVRRFLACNFGEYDQYNFDVDEDGDLNFEEVSCPLRGECKDENIICKPELFTRLTFREKEILRLMSDGRTNIEIAEVLFIEENTVKKHKNNIMDKTGIRNSTGLVSFYYRRIKC